jgi:hypothetical protein
VADIPIETEFTIAGTFRYFPTVYEEAEGQTAVIGNLDFLFEQIGGVLLHNIWLEIDPDADQDAMIEQVEKMGVFISRWVDLREETAIEQARVERIGIFGTLTIGFLAAAVLSGIGIWASRLFIPFFQAADQNVLNPPRLIALVAWNDIIRISSVFTIVLVAAQIAVIFAALREGVFQALQLGDRE